VDVMNLGSQRLADLGAPLLGDEPKSSKRISQLLRGLFALALSALLILGVVQLWGNVNKTSLISLSSTEEKQGRVFLHIADTHADPFYDYTGYWKPQANLCRDPAFLSNKKPAASCGKFAESVESILAHWNGTGENAMGRGGGPACPCGHYGANPPFSVLASLTPAIASHDPEFVLWSGDFASHYEPGTHPDDACETAKMSAKATVTMLNARVGKHGQPIQHLWAWGNNDVLPKRQPLRQEWLEDFGAHLLKEGWLTAEEYEGTWKRGGYYKRTLGGGLCAIVLNSNSWTANQINEAHHQNQLEWLETAFHDADCAKYLLNAHVPLGWLEGSKGHHEWNNLEGAVVHEYAHQYRAILNGHADRIVAELYGHINKAALRLQDSKHGGGGGEQTDELAGDEPTSVSSQGDAIGDLDEDIDGDAHVVSFTVAGISRRGMNDPQFQKVILEPDLNKGIQDILVYTMKRAACYADAFTFAYSFRELFEPDLDDGINIDSVERFVQNEKQRARVEAHLALTSMPYDKSMLKNTSFLAAVRAGQTGC